MSFADSAAWDLLADWLAAPERSVRRLELRGKTIILSLRFRDPRSGRSRIVTSRTQDTFAGAIRNAIGIALCPE